LSRRWETLRIDRRHGENPCIKARHTQLEHSSVSNTCYSSVLFLLYLVLSPLVLYYFTSLLIHNFNSPYSFALSIHNASLTFPLPDIPKTSSPLHILRHQYTLSSSRFTHTNKLHFYASQADSLFQIRLQTCQRHTASIIKIAVDAVGYLVKAARAPMVTMVKAVGKTPHKAVAAALFPVKVVKAVKLIRAVLDSVSHVASLSPGSCKFDAHRELTTNLSSYLYLVM
jgi:hypothetical protein